MTFAIGGGGGGGVQGPMDIRLLPFPYLLQLPPQATPSTVWLVD